MKQSHYFLYSYVFIAITLVADTVYQPWALENDRFDLFMPSVAPSFFGSLAITFLFIGYKYCETRNKVVAAASVGVGCMIYESVQQLFGLGTFDIKDLIASAIATSLVIGNELLAQRRTDQKAI